LPKKQSKVKRYKKETGGLKQAASFAVLWAIEKILLVNSLDK
jgi:hypothetical protein